MNRSPIRKAAGFTLLEVMLVMVVLSLSVTAVVINLPDSEQDLAKEQGRRFFHRLQLLNEEAMLSGRDFGIRIEADKASYTYLELTMEGWQEYQNRKFPVTELEEGLELEFSLGSSAWQNGESLFSQESLFDEEMFDELDGELFDEEGNEKKRVAPPQLFVISSGEITPFLLTVYPQKTNPALDGWQTEVKESGEILLHRPGERAGEEER